MFVSSGEMAQMGALHANKKTCLIMYCKYLKTLRIKIHTLCMLLLKKLVKTKDSQFNESVVVAIW